MVVVLVVILLVLLQLAVYAAAETVEHARTGVIVEGLLLAFRTLYLSVPAAQAAQRVPLTLQIQLTLTDVISFFFVFHTLTSIP